MKCATKHCPHDATSWTRATGWACPVHDRDNPEPETWELFVAFEPLEAWRRIWQNILGYQPKITPELDAAYREWSAQR